MLSDISYLQAFLMGLLGAVHCVGMCGGIVGALSFGLSEDVRASTHRFLPYLLGYNGGRIASYVFAGALMGGLGSLAASGLSAVHEAKLLLQFAAGAFMIVLGLYLGGWWLGLARVERAGVFVWRRLEPLGRRFIPVRTPYQAVVLGLVWGWLPCGLVYTALIWSISGASIGEGALLMLSFGIGTLPSLLAMGVFAAKVSRALRNLWVRRFAGALVIGFGLLTLARSIVSPGV